MRVRLAASAGFVALFILTGSLRAEQVPPETYTRVSRSIVRVTCRTGDHVRVGTGFSWPDTARVVTAMHVVAGCERISASYETLKVQRDAQLIAVLGEADLALLRVKDPPAVTALSAEAREPGLNDDLVALGYELGSPTMGSKTLRISFGSAILQDMLPETYRREIAGVGSPSLNLRILRLEGHLLPGMSGAPIVNAKGTIVGIGDGGLEHGAASVSWALPASNLSRLERSKEAVAGVNSRGVNSLFAADIGSTAGPARRCGSLTFTKTRTRKLEEIARSVDDPLGLQQLIASSGGLDTSGYAFDIYVEKESGATVVVPAGMELRARSGVCVGQSPSGDLRIYISAVRAASTDEAQQASLAFESTVARDVPLGWMADPQWTYPTPHPRFDGMIVRRRAYVGYNPASQPTGYEFETLMARGNVFAGVAAVNLAYNPSLAYMCMQNPGAPVCGQIRARMTQLAPFIFAVHLSTFPIG